MLIKERLDDICYGGRTECIIVGKLGMNLSTSVLLPAQ